MATNEEGKVIENAAAALAGKYLTFLLADEVYGVEILRVQEIMGMLPITRVPQSPRYLKGVINLRGKVIPVVDLRLKLDMPEHAYDERTCIIVINANVGACGVMVGLVVDSVREVYNFASNQLEPPPTFGINRDASAILGMGKIDDQVVTLLDLDKALRDTDFGQAMLPTDAAKAAQA